MFPPRSTLPNYVIRLTVQWIARLFTKTPVFCGAFHGHPDVGATNLWTVATKYYTHFVTGTAQTRNADNASEWSGVVELRQPLEASGGTRELRSLLAQSFELDSEEIKILHWARLH
jgi:hypothetical protein